MTKIRVNKPDAARRQIDMAIELFFDQRDPVLVHSLAMAAFRILADLVKAKGLKDQSIIGKFDKMIRPGMERVFWGHIHGAANFFKHADRDPDEILDDRDERINDGALWMCVMLYVELGYAPTPEMKAFNGWFAATNPHLLLDGHPLKQMGTKIDWAHQVPRNEQLELGRYFLDQFRTEGGQPSRPEAWAP